MESHKRYFQINLNMERPLHRAIGNAHIEIIQELLDKGVDVNQMDNIRVTPLFKACKQGNIQIIEILFRHGAIIDDVTLSFMFNGEVMNLLNEYQEIQVKPAKS